MSSTKSQQMALAQQYKKARELAVKADRDSEATPENRKELHEQADKVKAKLMELRYADKESGYTKPKK